MTRIMMILAALLIALAAFLMFRNQANDSKITPPAVKTPIEVQASADSDFHTWNEFTSENGLFKVLLPGIPQYVTDMVIDQKTLEPRKFETYALAANNGSAYVINVISLPPDSKPDEAALKAAVTDMLDRNKENKLKHMEMGTLHGKPALDFSFNNNEVSIEGKVLSHQNQIYILSMIGKDDVFDKKNFDFFVNSFEFEAEKK